MGAGYEAGSGKSKATLRGVVLKNPSQTGAKGGLKKAENAKLPKNGKLFDIPKKGGGGKKKKV